jgi:hypothetical protein
MLRDPNPQVRPFQKRPWRFPRLFIKVLGYASLGPRLGTSGVGKRLVEKPGKNESRKNEWRDGLD